MRLLLREYFETLRESEELDAILPLLLLSMGVPPVHSPQRGVSQFGVDIHAVGIDPDDGKKKNFLISVKAGNIDRTAWNSGAQTVRQSLDDIREVYIPKKLTREQKKLPNKIILCCGGELRQDTQDRWDGYLRSYSKRKNKIELWDSNKLSLMFEKHLLTDALFVGDSKIEIRRTLAFIGDPDYNLVHFKRLINGILNGPRLKRPSGQFVSKKVVHAIRIIKLCLGLVLHHSQGAGVTKTALLGSEFALLSTWAFIIKNGLTNDKKIVSSYFSLYALYFQAGVTYFDKVLPSCEVQDGLTRYCRSSITASSVVLEQIGIFASMGITQMHFGVAEENSIGVKNAESIADALESIIKNHTTASSLIYDGQTIDVCLCLYFLAMMRRSETIKQYMRDIVFKFFFSYAVIGEHFPICYDSIDHLIEFEFRKERTKEEMTSMSTLIPTLAYWCAALSYEDIYEDIVKFVNDHLGHSSLQLWYPTAGCKKQFFEDYAGDLGTTEVPILLPEKLDALRARIRKLLEDGDKHGLEMTWKDTPPGLALVASRHFRTPVVPFYWLNAVTDERGTATAATPEATDTSNSTSDLV